MKLKLVKIKERKNWYVFLNLDWDNNENYFGVRYAEILNEQGFLKLCLQNDAHITITITISYLFK